MNESRVPLLPTVFWVITPLGIQVKQHKSISKRTVPIFCHVPYTPECNPIELVFRMVKVNFKKFRLQDAPMGVAYDCPNIVRRAIAILDDEKI